MTDSTSPAANLTQRANPDPGEQLRLQFFAVLDGYRGNPPEKALMRVLLDCALKGVDRFVVGGRAIAASVVDHVAVRLYLRSNEAGIVEGFSVETIAADVKRDKSTVKRALAVLRRLHVFRSTRASRRRPETHRINVGGLDWPAVRERAKAARVVAHGNHSGASGGPRQPLSGGPRQPLKGYDVGLDVRPAHRNHSGTTSLLEIARDPSGRAFAFVDGQDYDGEPVCTGRPSADWNEGGDP